MNYAKLDTALSLALKQQSSPTSELAMGMAGSVSPQPIPILSVWVQTAAPPDTEQTAFLQEQGVIIDTAAGKGEERKLFTASLSPESIEWLSEQSWIHSLRLSQSLSPKQLFGQTMMSKTSGSGDPPAETSPEKGGHSPE